MTLREEISINFQAYNIDLSDEVLEKCVEICTDHNVDPEDLVERWCAYTVSNLNGGPPTRDALDKLERKEFKKQNKELNVSKPASSTPKTSKHKPLLEPDIGEHIITDSSEAIIPAVNDAVTKSKTPAKTNGTSTPGYLPQQQSSQRDIDDSTYFSTSQVAYTERTNSLSACCSYGISASFRRQCDIQLNIKLHRSEDLPQHIYYMYEIMAAKAAVLDSIANEIGPAIIERNHLEFRNISLKGNTGEMVSYGRICSESEDKINSQSLLLEGTMKLSRGHTTKLATNKLTSYSLFPGQIVAVEGNNLNGNTFYANTIYIDAMFDFPKEPPQINEPLEIVVAAGPFTLQSNLTYEPLEDLIQYVLEFHPHVLILLGPFLEPTHPAVHTGELKTDFDDFFEQVLERITTSLAGSRVKIVIVSSSKDAHHHKVYPTPPYTSKENYPNVTFVPDPCTININGLTIGMTSADVLFHIAKKEVYVDKSTGGGDKFVRLASYLLQQRSFYPLYPPDDDMSIDHELLLYHGMLDYTPHMLILPSNFRNFIKNVKGCMVINPERLTRGFVAGSFARIEVIPGSNDEPIINRIASQVLKI